MRRANQGRYQRRIEWEEWETRDIKLEGPHREELHTEKKKKNVGQRYRDTDWHNRQRILDVL